MDANTTIPQKDATNQVTTSNTEMTLEMQNSTCTYTNALDASNTEKSWNHTDSHANTVQYK